jgi:Sec-independent protein translocase protein TatA
MVRQTMPKKNRNRKKILLIVATVFLGVVVLLFGLEKTKVTNLIGVNGLIIKTRKEKISDGVNYGPTTEQERQETEQHKDDLANDTPETPQTDSGGLNVVTPVISYADSQSVSAYIPEVFEEGGTCTAMLLNGSASVTRESAGFGNASYTQCAPIDISGTGAGKGWTVQVEYSSTKSKGSSVTTTIQ